MTTGIGQPMEMDVICICGHARKFHNGPTHMGQCHSGLRPCSRRCSSFIKTTLEREIARSSALDDAIAAIQARIDVLYDVKETRKEGRARLGLTDAREILKGMK